MNNQLNLDQIAARWSAEALRERKFERFHQDNPEVYTEIIRVARQLKARGFRQCGMKLIFERLRWLRAVRTRSDDGFKLNNNWTAFYARLIMAANPDLRGFFRLREQELEYVPDLDALGL